jgi:hypothetical protein
MKPETERYLSSRLAEHRAGDKGARVLGLSKKVTTCDHCGRKDLSKTLAVQMPSGRVVHLGTDCADQIRRERVAHLSGQHLQQAHKQEQRAGGLSDSDLAEGSVLHALKKGELERVPTVVRHELPGVLKRALTAGAKPPLEFVGAGMTGLVFLDTQGHAWKVARRTTSSLQQTFAEEAEWLHDAQQVPYVRDHVAKIIAFHPSELAIEREYVRGRAGGWGSSGIWEIHREIERQMVPSGWTAPEYKEDSYVLPGDTGSNWVLVDASMPHRVGMKLVQKAVDLMSGEDEIDPGLETPQDYSFYIRREMHEGTVPKDVGDRVLEKLAECKKFPCKEDAASAMGLGSHLSTTGTVVRGVGEETGGDELAAWNRPGHVYRGMTQDEWYSVIAKGVIQSTMRYSLPSEGTSFAEDIQTAESYVNFGRDDPRQTARPTYLVEVKRLDLMEKDPRDGYLKARKPVPSSAITRVWRMVDEDGAVVAYQIR